MAASQNAISSTKAALRGQVIDCAGTPVGGAELWLYYSVSHWGLDDRVVEKVLSDANGCFAFSQPLSFKTPNGTDRHDHYVLLATRDGFALAWKQIVGGSLEEHDFTLQLTAPVSQNFEGVDLNGQPMEGATVWLRCAVAQGDKAPRIAETLLLPQDLGICHAVTDASGKATIANLPDTRWNMTVSKPGFEDETGGRATESGLRFRLKPGATLEGRVTDPSGLAVEGATVWLYPKFRWHNFFMARTDADGRYRIDKIWSNGEAEDWGKYQAGIRSPDFTATTREVAFTSGHTISGFDFSASPGTEIVGTLLDPATQQPVAGSEVYIDGSTGRQTRLTDSSGMFRCRVMPETIRIFFGLPPGGTFAVDDRGSRENPSSLETRVFGTEFPVTLYTPSALGKLGTMRGKVVDRSGRPLPFCHVTPSIANDPRTRIVTSGWIGNIFRNVYTQDDGTFTLTLPIGFKFTLTAANPAGEETGISSAELTSDSLEISDPIVLQSTQSADLIVTDLSGASRPHFAVDVVPQAKGADLWFDKKSYETDGQGRLHLENITPGLTYRIAEKNSQYAWAIFDPVNQIEGTATKLCVTDRCILRVLDSQEQPLAVKYLKEFFVWILSHGKRSRWTHTFPDANTLEKLGPDVTLPCKYVVLAKPGDQIDLMVETERGDLVRASSTVPAPGAAVLVARATEIAGLDYTEDPSLIVEPDEVAGRVIDPEGRPVAGATLTFNGVFWLSAAAAGGQSGANWRREPTFTTDADGVFRASPAKAQWFVYETIFKEGFAPVFLTDIPRGKGFIVTLQKTTRLAGTIGGDRPGKVSLVLEKDKDTTRAQMGNRVRNIQYRTETDESGAYDFPIEPGTYRRQGVEQRWSVCCGRSYRGPGSDHSHTCHFAAGRSGHLAFDRLSDGPGCDRNRSRPHGNPPG